MGVRVCGYGGLPINLFFSDPLQMTKVLTTEEPQNPAGDEMQAHQDTFLRNILGQQKLANIDVHVSALVAILGNTAPSDTGFRITRPGG
jgi:hypothetical protein